ncbi:hypothetical protein OH809_09075 [Streptomyces sp. NBC_00873]|nr:hypothetical protein OH809_09075 [Streptomyces sp. NBC_00873]WTA47162.1 hypothetical protein OH821_34745 [Streptomyces sp. NBC_00842]
MHAADRAVGAFHGDGVLLADTVRVVHDITREQGDVVLLDGAAAWRSTGLD